VAYLGAAQLLGKTKNLVVPGWVAYLAPAVGVTCFTLALRFWSAQARHYQSTGQ
jgi:viologen exporter family transport system permease protein